MTDLEAIKHRWALEARNKCREVIDHRGAYQRWQLLPESYAHKASVAFVRRLENDVIALANTIIEVP